MIKHLFEFFQHRKVVLRDEQNKNDRRHLSAELKDNGDLVFAGQDLGSEVEKIFGSGLYEYEWSWTIKESDIALLQKAIGGKGDILKLLEKNFSNEKAGDLYEFMCSNNIPFEKWSRIGD